MYKVIIIPLHPYAALGYEFKTFEELVEFLKKDDPHCIEGVEKWHENGETEPYNESYDGENLRIVKE